MGESRGQALPLAGTVLADRYELRSPLGSGGMAQVWEGFDRLLGRRVAVKLLHPHLQADPAFVRRFRQEAVAVARLVHPNIVAVYDTIGTDGQHAIVMELVDGVTLRHELDEHGPMDENRVRRLGRDLAGALDCAHRNGLVHRDIKPANVLLTPEGSARLTDFGIAKAEEDPDLTLAGTLVGTAAYLAPEQVGGGSVDARTDLYALSTVLYEAASGTVPFRADSPAATALARLHQDPAPLAEQDPRLSPQFCAAIMRNLAHAPEHRFQTATAFAAALAERPSRSTAGSGRLDNRPPRDDTSTPTPTSPMPAVFPAGRPVVPPTRRRSRRRPGRRRSVVGRIVLALLIVGPVALIAALAVDRNPGSGSHPSTTVPVAAHRPAVRAAIPYDPMGDHQESNAVAGRAIDGDPTSGWSTEQYKAQDFGTKPGVGLVLDLGGRHRLRSLTITGSTGWKGRLYLANHLLSDDPAPPAGGGSALDIGSSPATVGLGGRVASSLLIWITDLGPATGVHHVNLDELVVSGS